MACCPQASWGLLPRTSARQRSAVLATARLLTWPRPCCPEGGPWTIPERRASGGVIGQGSEVLTANLTKSMSYRRGFIATFPPDSYPGGPRINHPVASYAKHRDPTGTVAVTLEVGAPAYPGRFRCPGSTWASRRGATHERARRSGVQFPLGNDPPHRSAGRSRPGNAATSARAGCCTCNQSTLRYLRLQLYTRRGARQGGYREGFAGCGALLRAIGETTHQSCVVVTSREAPPELAVLSGHPVRTPSASRGVSTP